MLILISNDRREVRITTGLGMQEIIPDTIVKKIIEQISIPEFKQNNFYLGVDKTIDEIIKIYNRTKTIMYSPDFQLKQKILSAFLTERAAFSKVSVTIQDSVVILTGEIKRTNLRKVLQIVNEFNPKKIINSLTIVE